MPLILIFGADGQVGWELQRSLSIHGTVLPLPRALVNLADAAAVRTTLRNMKPDAIINAGAYTAVDKAETESELAFAVNATAPGIMAEEARAAGVPLIHYSTDYAYGGTKHTPYIETDPANPQSVYARSKVAGDEAILTSGANAVILRTSWVFAARGANFLRTILRHAADKESMRIVSDQVGAPTSAELLADVTAQVLAHIYRSKSDIAELSRHPGEGRGPVPSGLFHCTASGETSWHGYASFIVSEARQLGANLKLTPERIEPIPTEAYPLPAPRPKNSRLDCSKLERTFGVQLPPWQVHVKRALRELLN